MESYENILEVLLNKPLTLHSLALKTRLDRALMRRFLEFLLRNGLVEEREAENESFYAITEKGTAVIRALNFHKYLQRIKGTIRAIDEALEIIPGLAKLEHSSESSGDRKNTC